MRIIGGRLKGHRITPPSKIEARPTTDFAREGLFNILNNRVEFSELKVLDLFSGTGAITFEFFSRGTTDLTSVDSAPLSYTFISQMARKFEIRDLKLLKSDVFEFLKKHREKYDLIFADPPYGIENLDDIHRLVMENNLLAEDGELIIEHSGRTDLSHLSGFIDQRKYGNVNFSFFSQQT